MKAKQKTYGGGSGMKKSSFGVKVGNNKQCVKAGMKDAKKGTIK